MIRKLSIALFILTAFALVLSGQTDTAAQIDTTSEWYRNRYLIGKEIGQWLPFAILITLVLMVMIRASRLKKK